MPEGIDLNTLLNEAAGGDNTPPVADNKQDTPPATGDNATPPQDNNDPNKQQTQGDNVPPAANGNTDPNAADQTGGNGQKDNNDPNAGQEKKPNPMKEVRDKLNAEQKAKEKIETTIQRLMNGDYKFGLKDFKTEDGKIDYDKLISAMDEQDTKTKAETRGITPEMQLELDRIEKEKLELQKEKLQVAMDRSLSELQVTMGMDSKAVNKFFADAMAVKKNPYQWLGQGGSLSELYYLVYKDTLTQAAVDKAVAEAKTKWEASLGNVPPTSNPAAQSQAGSKDGLSLDQLLAEALKK